MSVGIYALINVHEYYCIVIRMRCWLVDDYLLSKSKGLLLSNAKAHWLGLVGYKTRGPADIRRPIEQSFL